MVYSAPIEITPPLYTRWWFMALVGLGLAVFGYAIRSFMLQKTNEKRLKLAIIDKVSEVKQSESKFQAIWESMDSGVAVINQNGTILMANPSFSRLLRIKADEIIGKEISALLDHSRFTNSFIEEWYRNPSLLKFEIEIQKAASVQRFLTTFTCLRNLRPNQTLLMIGLKDISEQKETEMKNLRLNELLVRQNRDLVKKELELATFNQELLKRQEDLQEALKVLEERNFELDQFVYKTSHDLRAPIASSLGLLNIMKMEGVSASWPGYIDMITRSLQKQDSFIKAMLNFSKTARASENPEPIEFKPLIEQCLNDLQYLPGYDEIVQQIEVTDLNGGFYSDKMKINIILSNILSNSIKYRDHSKASSYLNILIETNHDQARIMISDNGIGINKSYLEHIFKMFYRATERSDGSGLGLYIVKQTIERLGGKIEVDSELGKGSCFKIIIPNLRDKVSTEVSAQLQQEGEAPTALGA